MTARQVVHSMLNTKSALAAVILATAILPLASAVPVEARSGGQHHAHPAANPAPGSWTRLGPRAGRELVDIRPSPERQRSGGVVSTSRPKSSTL